MPLTRLDKAPFPFFGGKADAAPTIWAALGDVPHYVEPFMGSLAVLLRRPHPCNRTYYSETVNDIDGHLCLAPETRLLGEDLRWRPIGELLPGARLLAFDESNGPPLKPGLGAPSRFRRMAVATVTATHRVVKPCYRLSFSDGTTVVASADHQWLCGSHRADAGGRAWRWTSTKGMVANRGWQRSWVLKVCDVVEQEQTYEAGWLGGFLDGEGNVRRMDSGRAGWSVNCTQKVGPEADRYAKLLDARGFVTSKHAPRLRTENHKLQQTVEVHGKRQVLRLLMQTRPERLITNLINHVTDRSLYGREHSAVSLESKEFLGECEVVALETDTHTYIAEGLASHNCNAWRAIQLHPDATAEAASWPVSECDLMSRHMALLRWAADKDFERLMADPAWCDPVMAGWWIWGCSSWIGGGWCSGDGPWVVGADGRITAQAREPGVSRQRPHLGDDGKGVNHAGAREPGVGEEPEFHPMTMPEIRRWFAFLAARLRHVRILCGDWSRAVTTGAALTLSVRQGHGPCGIFLDPPYSTDHRAKGCYTHDGGTTLAAEVRAWCLQWGKDRRYRIVLAGFAGEGHEELEKHGWRSVEWFRAGFLKGGMGNLADRDEETGERHQQKRERLWLSPHTLRERTLFDEPEADPCEHPDP